MSLERVIRNVLAPYPLGLTAKEVRRVLQARSIKAKPKDIREVMSGIELAVDGLERRSISGRFEMPGLPSQVPVTYLVNRTVTIRGPSDKKIVQGLGARYHVAQNYKAYSKPFAKAFMDTCQEGHQLILGGFYPQRKTKDKITIKSKPCLAYLQCLMVEFDEDLGYKSLSDMALNHEFISQNAALLMESVSGFPKSRAFFMLPYPLFSEVDIEIVVRMLVNEFGETCDPSGSRPANGCFGRFGGEYLLLDKWLNVNALHGWAEEWNAETHHRPKQKRRIQSSEIKVLAESYHDFMERNVPNMRGWYGRVPCPHVKHENDGWTSLSNACEIRPSGNGFLTACWKCPSDDPMLPAYRYISREALDSTRKSEIVREIRNQFESESAFIKSILDGSMEVPQVEERPSYEQLEEWKRERVKKGDACPLELRRPPVKLVKSEEVAEVISLVDSDEMIKQAFRNDARIVGINAPTGAGKDETHMSIVLDSDLYSIETKPHHLVAEEKTRRWQEHTTAVRWMGVTSGELDLRDYIETHGYERLLEDPFPAGSTWKCIQPDRVWGYREQGGNRHVTICSECPVRDACSRQGFNAQSKHVKDHRAIVLAIEQLFTNPVYENFSRKLYSTEENGIRLAAMDEVMPSRLFLECKITDHQLQRWRIMWKGMELADFADEIELILMRDRNMHTLADYIMGLDDETAMCIMMQMEKVRERYTRADVEVVDPEDSGRVLSKIQLTFSNQREVALALDSKSYDRLIELEIPAMHRMELTADNMVELNLDEASVLGIYGNLEKMDGATISASVPRVYARNWNPLVQLQILFERYPVERAPISYDPPTDVTIGELRWEVPPQLHDHIKRIMCMSATLDETLFREAFSEYADDIEFVRVPPTPLAEGSVIFQIRTGKYCRSSVLKMDKKSQPIGWKPAGERFWEMFKYEVERDREITHALITYKHILEWKSAWIEEQPNIMSTANYWGLVGLNQMQHADYIWVMFDPELDGKTIERYAKRFWGDDEEPLNFDREDGEYLDDRVRQVWEGEVVGELVQAVGRARLNRKQGNVIILTGLNIPSITDREETRLFDYVDWELDKNLTRMTRRIERRADAEIARDALAKQVLDALKSGEPMSKVAKRFKVQRHWVRRINQMIDEPSAS